VEFCTELRCVTHILTHYLRHFHHAAGFQHNFADKGEHGAQQSDICCFKADLETRHFLTNTVTQRLQQLLDTLAASF